MRRSSLFGHTAELLDQILSTRRPADLLTREFYRKRHYLGSRDRRFISDLLYGVLRHYGRMAFLLRTTLSRVRPGIDTVRLPSIGLCAAYALRVLGDPPQTLLPDIEGLWRTTTTDVDPAVLLRALAETEIPPEILSNPVRRIALEHSFPEFIVREWLERFGTEGAEALCAASNLPAPTTLRVNRLRTDRQACLQALTEAGAPARYGTLSPDALLLEKRTNLPSLRPFREGWIELQDEGSQLIGLLLGVQPGDRVVDACSGGGGKTLHLAALMGNQGTILCLDTDEERVKGLNARLSRAGVSIAEVHVTPEQGGRFPSWEEGADSVLVDAPCSGSGTFRRNPGAKLTVTEQYVRSLCAIQHNILLHAARFVRPSGRLVYSTCSLLQSENESVVERFLSERSDFRIVPAATILRTAGVPIETDNDTMTLFPHRHSTDGYFAAAMERSAER